MAAFAFFVPFSGNTEPVRSSFSPFAKLSLSSSCAPSTLAVDQVSVKVRPDFLSAYLALRSETIEPDLLSFVPFTVNLRPVGVVVLTSSLAMPI
jgi:hypothetical protein